MNRNLIHKILNIGYVVLVLFIAGLSVYSSYLDSTIQYRLLFSDDPDYNRPETEYYQTWPEEINTCDEAYPGAKRCAVGISETFGRPTVLWGVEGGPKIEAKTKMALESKFSFSYIDFVEDTFFWSVWISLAIPVLYFVADKLYFRFRKIDKSDHILSTMALGIFLTLPVSVVYGVIAVLLGIFLKNDLPSVHPIALTTTIVIAGLFALFLYWQKLRQLAIAIPIGTVLMALLSRLD